MRLTPYQIATILNTAHQYFGKQAQIWLFGSRVNDAAKGGDIDLYIEPEWVEPAKLIDAKLYFLRDLHRHLGEQKIDVVLRPPNSAAELSIYQIAKQTGIQLQ